MLVDDLSSDAKLFPNNISLFTIVYDENIAAEQLNNDLKIISEWAYQWKLQFNPHKTKQVVQVMFSQKRIKPTHPPLYFNKNQIAIKKEQKHLDLILNSGLTFHSHLSEKIISAIRFLSQYALRDVLDQMDKLYVRPHLDYGDIIYHKFDPEFTLEFTRKL